MEEVDEEAERREEKWRGGGTRVGGSKVEH